MLTELERARLTMRKMERHYEKWLSHERKLHMIWRAIARRHLSRCTQTSRAYHDGDGETDP